MAKIAEVAPARRASVPADKRRIRVVVRKVQPWSILRVSLIFYFCIMLIVLFGLAILYWVLGALGVLDSLAKFIGGLGFGDQTFEFHGGWIFTWLFIIGLIGVVAWSFINVCVAFLYNLISDIVGGVEVTLTEKR